MSSNGFEKTDAARKILPPLVIDLGKLNAKKAKALRKGKGPFQEEVEPALAKAMSDGQQENGEGEILPIVMIYQKRPKRRKGDLMGMLPLRQS